MNTTPIGWRMVATSVAGMLAMLLIVGSAAAGGGERFASAPSERGGEQVVGTLELDRTTPEPRGPMNFRAPPATAGGPYTVPPVFKAGPGCSIQCITSGVAYARGPNAELVVKTDTLARIWIHVQGPNNYYRVENSGADEVQEFRFLFDDLQAGTTYTAWAEAKDTSGYVAEAHGSFKTLTRNVEIYYTEAHIIERKYSNATFQRDVWLQGQWEPSHTVAGLEQEGSTVFLGLAGIPLTNVDRYLDFAIQLAEMQPGCNNSGQFSQPVHVQSSCSFSSFAQLLEGQNDLDARPVGATSWTEWTLQRTLSLPAGLWPPYLDGNLLFTVPVSLHVTYTPAW